MNREDDASRDGAAVSVSLSSSATSDSGGLATGESACDSKGVRHGESGVEVGLNRFLGIPTAGFVCGVEDQPQRRRKNAPGTATGEDDRELAWTVAGDDDLGGWHSCRRTEGINSVAPTR
jgi:hypothetical protein